MHFTILKATRSIVACSIIILANGASAQTPFTVRDHYDKFEYKIAMRDGVKLFTSVYVPKDHSQKYPVLMDRTPYSVGPYGPNSYKGNLGPSHKFDEDGYIFVFQDVRGRNYSEGDFVDVRPHMPKKNGPKDIDESTDTYDSIDWLIKNIPNNNGRVGIWGISYPGFYTSAGAIDSHPALKAVSPQAPVSNWFIGDDFHHNGAFFLTDAIFFYNSFGRPRSAPGGPQSPPANMNTSDTYKFLLEMGPLKNADTKYRMNEIEFWRDLMSHPNYDEFWRARNILPNLKNIKCPVMTVGGLFDAEDMWGALHTYAAIEKQDPGIKNTLVMGPWTHGGWQGYGDRLGDISFGDKTGVWYQENVMYPFFNYYLKDKGTLDLPKALIFNTGANTWRKFSDWPPANAKSTSFYLQSDHGLAIAMPKSSSTPGDSYLSDPANPVPFASHPIPRHPNEYLIEDQRFVSSRPDVLSYQTAPLTQDLTLTGYINVDLFVSTTGTDSDFVAKIIDVYPEDAPPVPPSDTKPYSQKGGYQMLVRAEVMRGRFRHSFEKPEPFKPGQVAQVKWELPAICHTFKKGHRLMVQIQSSWFPLADLNPQKFVDIYHASESDFQKSSNTIMHSSKYPSHITVGVLKD